MEPEIEELLENAEPIEDGLSNNVFLKDDKVIKLYSRFPATSFYVSVLEIIHGNLRYVTRTERMQKEQDVKKDIKKAGLKTAEITNVGKKSMVFMKVPGLSGYEFLNSCEPEEAERFGERAKDFLEKLHSRDVAIRDCRVSNFIVDGEDLYSIDHEYSSTNPGKIFRFLDELTIISSARQTERYHEFIEGFQPHRFAVYLSVITAVYHNLLFERELFRFKRIFASLT